MLVQGRAYVDGAGAEDGTVVEARIGGETVGSTTTETVDGQQGRYSLAFEGESGELVGFAIGGEEARAFGAAGLVERVPFEMGGQDYVLFVGEFPLEQVYLPVMVFGQELQTVERRARKPAVRWPGGKGGQVRRTCEVHRTARGKWILKRLARCKS